MARSIEFILSVESQIQGLRDVIEAFENTEKAAQRAGNVLAAGFEPRVIKNVGDFRTALEESASALENYANLTQRQTGLDSVNADILRQVAAAYREQAAATTFSSAALAEQGVALNSVRVQGEAQARAIELARNQALQYSRAAAEMNQVITTQSGNVALMGQAMVASFSASQIAAGNLQQGIFGLGFSFLFLQKAALTPQFLALTAAFAAAGAALEALTGLFGKSKTAAEEASDAVKEWREALEKLAGAPALAAKEIQGLIDRSQELGVSFEDLVAKRIQEGSIAFRAYGSAAQEAAAQSGASIQEMIKQAEELAGQQSKISEFFSDVPVLGPVTSFAFGGADKDAQEAFQKIREEIEATGEAIERDLIQKIEDLDKQMDRERRLKIEIEAAQNFADFQTGFIDKVIENIEAGKEAAIESIRDGADDLMDARREAGRVEIEGLRQGLADAIDARRDELQKEIDAINEWASNAIDARRDALDEELSAIEESFDQQVEARRDALEAEIQALEDAHDAFADARRDALEDELDAIRTNLDEQVKERQKALKKELDEINKNYDLQVDARKDRLDDELDAANEKFDDMVDARKKALEEEKKAIDDKFDDMVDARRDALDKELQAIEDAVDAQVSAIKAGADAAANAVKDKAKEQEQAVRQGLDAQIREIRDAAKDQVDLRKKALDDEIDSIKKTGKQRMDAVKAAADAELEENKKRIAALKNQEKDLTKQLDELAKRRQELVAASLSTAAELARLEELQASGVNDAALQREIALRKGRLDAIHNEQAGIGEQTNAINEQIAAVENQIAEEEKKGDAIKAARDAQLEAIKEEIDQRVELAKEAADAEIEQINRVRDEAINAARARADAQIQAIQAAADAEIASIQAAADAAIREAKRVADEKKAAARDAADADIEIINEQRDAEIEAAKAAADADIENINKARDAELEAIKTVAETDIAAIEERRDAELEAARERADGDITEYRRAADDAMEAARERADADIAENRRATDEKIKHAQELADEEIKEINRRKEEAKKAATEAADHDITEINRAKTEAINAAKERADTAIAEMKRQVDGEILEAQRKIDDDIEDIKDRAQAQIDEVERTTKETEEPLKKMKEHIKEQTDEWIESRRSAERYRNYIEDELLPTLEDLKSVSRHPENVQAIIDFVREQLPRAKSEGDVRKLLDLILNTIPGFQLGGLVPGRRGEPVLIKAHAGEFVLRPDQLDALIGALSNTQRPQVTIHVNASSMADLDRLERTLSQSLGYKAGLRGRMQV